MDLPTKEHTKLINELKKHVLFIKGSLNDYCAKCNRSKCICKVKTKLRSYRLTYKDVDQKTKVVYVPRDRVSEVEKMLFNYKEVRRIMDDLFNVNIGLFKSIE